MESQIGMTASSDQTTNKKGRRSFFSPKSMITTFLKLAVAGGLIYFLVDGGKIDFRRLTLFFERWELAAANVSYWVFVSLAVGSLRWRFLLSGVGIAVKYLKTMLFTSIGLFFNAAIPGAVGGDIVKAIYVIRDEAREKKTAALVTIALDRILGLFGLFTIAAVAILANHEFLFSHGALRSICTAALGLFACLVLFFVSVFFPIGKNDLIRSILSKNIVGFSFLRQLYDDLCKYRSAPRALVYGWLCSMFIQGMLVCYFWYIANLLELTGGIGFGVFASITPLAVLTTALPLAPGGFGVGHYAFDRIMSFVGVEGGANIFNLFFIGQLVLNMIGFIPYILLKKPTSKEIPEELN